MLYRLEIENFSSIRERQVIDLRAAETTVADPFRLSPIWRGATERAPKVVAFFGANASGKSNVLKALPFLAWFVKDSFRAAPDAAFPFQPFNDEASQTRPTRLAVHLPGPADPENFADPEAPLCRYVFEVTLGGNRTKPRVLHESLKYWPPGKGRQLRLFERDEAGNVKADKTFGLSRYRPALPVIARPNAGLLSTLAQLGHPFSGALVATAGKLTTNLLTEKQELNEAESVKIYAALPQFLDALNRTIRSIDIGIREVRLEQSASGPIAMFDHEGLLYPMPSSLESHGTRQFVKTFPLIFHALQTGGVAAIDELDLAIHPLILPEILRWFHDPARNSHDAQLWMTCQNASLLEDLTKEETFFCEKDVDGRTKVYGLKDIQAVRRTDNHYRKYLGGAYGAIPRIG